ncbi:MAG: mycothiol system anti-sigma-R factor [Acidimicrobiales bacterium]
MSERGHDDCGQVIHRLYHFLDGELTDDRRHEIRRHLDDCQPCLEAFDFEAELRQVIAARCRDRVPDGLRDRVAAAIRHEEGPRAGAE